MYCKRFAFSGCKHSVLLLITTSDGNLPEVTEHNDKDEDDAAHCHRDEQSHLVDAVVHVICGGVRDGVEKEKKKKKERRRSSFFSHSRHSCRLHYPILFLYESSVLCVGGCTCALVQNVRTGNRVVIDHIPFLQQCDQVST